MAKYSVIFYILLNIQLGISVQLDCEYASMNVLNSERIPDVYSCEGRVNFDDDQLYITGYHAGKKNDEDVKGLQITKQNLEHFIRDIEKTLPNLAQINLSSNKIKDLMNDDLAPHKNLVYFMIDDNDITSLNSNIFDNLPKLKEFHAENNKLMHVQHDIRLPTDVSYYFKGNTCIDSNATNRTQIEKLTLDLLVKCPPTISQIEDNLEVRKNLFSYLIEENVNLTTKLRNLQEQNNRIIEALN